MHKEKQLLLEESIDKSINGQSFSERSTFGKKELLYFVFQAKQAKPPVCTDEDSLNSPFGSIVFTGNTQRPRTIELFYNKNKEIVPIRFFHDKQFVGEDELTVFLLTELFDESDGDINLFWSIFIDLIQELFVKTVFRAIKIKEEDFFDKTSRFFSKDLSEDRSFMDNLNYLKWNVSSIKEDIEKNSLSVNTDEKLIRAIQSYNSVLERILYKRI
jgi:hypothetical protein